MESFRHTHARAQSHMHLPMELQAAARLASWEDAALPASDKLDEVRDLQHSALYTSGLGSLWRAGDSL